jgi:hypothetical protein
VTESDAKPAHKPKDAVESKGQSKGRDAAKQPAVVVPELFRSDVPVSELTVDADAFGHTDYATAIASVLLEAKAPLTFGLFGPWGVGKTTIIEEVGRQLKGRAAFAYFDVWRYEGDALRRQFLRDVAGQLHPDEADFDPDEELTDLEEGSSRKVEKLGGLSGGSIREAVIRAVLAGLVVFVLLRALGTSSLRDEHGALRDVVISAALALLLFVLTPLTRIFRVTEEPLTKSRLEDPEHFTERFGALLRSLKRDRLVIAIDNLDRCEPESVEEFLSTVKTYLEPVGQIKKAPALIRLLKKDSKKEALFLIAADDAALRRHLEASEAALSLKQDRKKVAQYVDEYLRKFFTASIRMRPLLDQDVRTFAAGQLRDFATINSLDSETSRALTEMVAAALSRNPRRIKQFANNLEVRLRVIKQRESEGRISPPISNEVLVIAKLAILEEEWPDSWEALQANPRALDSWHAQLRDGQTEGLPPDKEDRAFLRLLSSSRDVRAENLSAFIRLKQSREEIELPRFADFREAVAMGTVGEVEDIVASDPDRASQYAKHLPTLLEDELSRGFLDGARSIVEAATSVPGLVDEDASVRRVLKRAVEDPELRRNLRNARPRPLFLASRLLTDEDRELLLNEFLDLQEFRGESSERLAEVLDAFGGAANLLSPALRRVLAAALTGTGVSQDFRAMLPVALADAELLPQDGGAAALAQLAELSELDPASPTLQVLIAWLGRSSPHKQQEVEFLAFVSRVLSGALAVEDSNRISMLDVLEQGAKRLRAVQADDVTTFLGGLGDPFGLWPPDTWPRILDLLGAVSQNATDESRPLLSPFVSRFFAEQPAAAIEFAASRNRDLAPALTLPVLEQLTAIAAGSAKDQRAVAADAILAIDPTDESGQFREALNRCIASNLFLTCGANIRRHKEVAREYVDPLASQALNQVRGLSDVSAIQKGLTFMVGLVDDLAPERLDELRDVLAQLLQSGDPERIGAASEAVASLAGTPGFRTRRRELVGLAFDHLKGVDRPLPAIVTFLARQLDQLERLERKAFIESLANLLKDPADRPELLRALQALPSLDAREREDLATALVGAEVLEPLLSNRIELLRVAKALAGKRGNSARVVNERLSELEKGAGDDLEVWKAVAVPEGEATNE